MENFEKVARAYALKNAIHYKGKTNQGAVISGLFAEGLKKQEVKKYSERISKIVSEVNKLSLDEQAKEYDHIKGIVSERETREGLSELPDVNKKKGVVMRFAPSPSGAMHIGHAITSCISYDYVKKYGGKFIMRIEDTNPENIYPPAYNLLRKDAEWLFNKEAEIVIQSDRMKIYYDFSEKLIKKNSAYVCTCSSEKFKGFSDLKENCPCRNNGLKENLYRWNKMLFSKEGYEEGGAVLRFKTPENVGGMKHKNPAMRDFPLARINLTEHPRQKKKYRVWPLMNLAVSADDIEMGMTHIIRAKEHRDNAERQKMIYGVLGLDKKYPWCFFLGRIHLKGMRLSATEFTKGIKEGIYSGWDDPSLPTVQSLRKKGYKPDAFWKMAEHIGLSEVDKVLDEKNFFELLDNFNKK